jgi:phospholipase/carboxylesterase
MTLEYETLQVGEQADYCVIWLHGLGADGHDFTPIVPELQLPDSPGIKFIFPHAPMQAVTINAGYVMRAWYDILAPDLTTKQDKDGIVQSCELVEGIVTKQNELGIPSEKIILAGFSQGGAIALHMGLRSQHQFAGIMALSTYLPLSDEFPLANASANSPSIFMAHGLFDTVVPAIVGMESRRILEDAGYTVIWKEYPMEHSVCVEEIRDISDWIQKITVDQ